MGGAMSKVVDGVYVGGLLCVRSEAQLSENNITHICTVLNDSTPKDPNRKHLVFTANDNPDEILTRFFDEACLFIHGARAEGGSVLVHCVCGASRSVTITLAYLMTLTDLPLTELYKSIRGARHCACPNPGFLRQLIAFEKSNGPAQLRSRIEAKYGPWPSEKLKADVTQLQAHKAAQEYFILHGVYPDQVGLHQVATSVSSDGNQTLPPNSRYPRPTYFTVTHQDGKRTLEEALGDQISAKASTQENMHQKDS